MGAIKVQVKKRVVVAVNFLRKKLNKYLDKWMDELEGGTEMKDLGDITGAVLKKKSELLGQIVLNLIEKNFSEYLNQKFCSCEECGKSLKSKESRKKTIKTLVGIFDLYRPYFYCKVCKLGFFPLDEALGLSSSSSQYDVQSIEAWLVSEMPYGGISEIYERILGDKLSDHLAHDTVSAMNEQINIADVCPPSEEIMEKVEKLSKGSFRRPIMMIGIDGAHAPTRPEPTPYSRAEKRGKGQWKEVKGFRVYLLNKKRIVHLVSWHQICDDEKLGDYLNELKNLNLIPDKKVRLCVIGDGAAWIWKQAKRNFPSAKFVLDYYHCSEHVHKVGNTQFGKGTKEAQEWCEQILTLLYFSERDDVNEILSEIIPKDEAAGIEIEKFKIYLKNHGSKMDYGATKRASYNTGSGAIESSNKFISNTRLKKSGAWWYINNANKILKLRCARYNGTFDRVMQRFKEKDQDRRKIKKFEKANLRRIK